MRRFFLVSITLTLACFSCLSQQTIPSLLIRKDTVEVPPTTELSVDTLGLRSGKVRLVHERNPKSGTLALLLSAGLPGAGQVYAQRYWTIPIIWGFGIYFASQYKKAADLYSDNRDQFEQSVLADTTFHQGNARLKEIRDFYRDERDRFAIYLGLTYALNLIDAYVGANLFAFDVSDNLGGNASIRFKIPIR